MKDQQMFEAAQYARFHEEKEKLNYLWIIEKKDLEDRKADMRSREREREDLAEAHLVEIKLYKQRIKHLLFEHQSESTDAKTDGQVSLKMSQEVARDSELGLKEDRRALQSVLKEMETAHEDFLKALKMDHDRAITELRLEFERESRELQSTFEERTNRTRETLTRDREGAVRGVERRKTKHIGALIVAHEKAFADIKQYYNEITHSNLDLIKILKDEVEHLKHKEAGDERVMHTIAQENKKMSEPMRRKLEEVARLREEKEAYRTEVGVLHEVKVSALVAQDKLENLRWELEILEQRHGRICAERDELYERFQSAMQDVQQKAGFRTLLLERRLAGAAEEVERASVTLAEVLGGANLDPRALGRLETQLSDVVAAKDAAAAELRSELGRVAAAHDRVLDAYMRKLAEYGVPKEELGFIPASSAQLLASSHAGAWDAASAQHGRLAPPPTPAPPLIVASLLRTGGVGGAASDVNVRQGRTMLASGTGSGIGGR